MTKQELRSELCSGKCLDDLFRFSCGQACFIFKSTHFVADDHICYIPDTDLNNIPLDDVVKGEDIDNVVSMCYTGDDFVDECGGDTEMAERLFWYCDWQHPSSAIDEITDDEETDEEPLPLSDLSRTKDLLQDVVYWMVWHHGREVTIASLFDMGFTADEMVALNLGSDNVVRVVDGYDPDLPFV